MKERAVEANIKRQTGILRTSQDSMVADIRRRLEAKGPNVKKLVVAEWFSDDTIFEFGIVVSDDGHVYQFGYD